MRKYKLVSLPPPPYNTRYTLGKIYLAQNGTYDNFLPFDNESHNGNFVDYLLKIRCIVEVKDNKKSHLPEIF